MMKINKTIKQGNNVEIVEYSDGSKEWYKDGKLHREDGPACEYTNGIKEYWINGEIQKVEWPEIK